MPAPPPPLPSQKLQNALLKNVSNSQANGANRSALLSQIQMGTTLKKTKSPNDRSSPNINSVKCKNGNQIDSAVKLPSTPNHCAQGFNMNDLKSHLENKMFGRTIINNGNLPKSSANKIINNNQNNINANCHNEKFLPHSFNSSNDMVVNGSANGDSREMNKLKSNFLNDISNNTVVNSCNANGNISSGKNVNVTKFATLGRTSNHPKQSNQITNINDILLTNNKNNNQNDQTDNKNPPPLPQKPPTLRRLNTRPLHFDGTMNPIIDNKNHRIDHYNLAIHYTLQRSNNGKDNSSVSREDLSLKSTNRNPPNFRDLVDGSRSLQMINPYNSSSLLMRDSNNYLSKQADNGNLASNAKALPNRPPLPPLPSIPVRNRSLTNLFNPIPIKQNHNSSNSTQDGFEEDSSSCHSSSLSSNSLQQPNTGLPPVVDRSSKRIPYPRFNEFENPISSDITIIETARRDYDRSTLSVSNVLSPKHNYPLPPRRNPIPDCFVSVINNETKNKTLSQHNPQTLPSQNNTVNCISNNRDNQKSLGEEFEFRFSFRLASMFPKPQNFVNITKIYPSKVAFRKPKKDRPPPPPPAPVFS